MKRLLALLPLLAAALVLSGCGSKDALTLDPVAEAASKTTNAGSSRVSFESTMWLLGKEVSFNAEGLYDYERSRGSLTMDMSALMPGMSGLGAFELRQLDSTLYMRMPAVAGAYVPQGKQWLSFDLDAAVDKAGLGGLNPANLQQDPSQFLTLLRASSIDVQEAGDDTVRGVDVTRYTARLDLRRSVDASLDQLELSDEQEAALRRAAEQLADQVGTKTIPVEVFVDADGRLRRLNMDLSMTVQGQRLALQQTVDYYDFGVEVDVDAPPAEQVYDLTNRLRSG
jgi:hypothetical protein